MSSLSGGKTSLWGIGTVSKIHSRIGQLPGIAWSGCRCWCPREGIRISGPCQMFRNISSKLVKRVWALSVSIDYMISMIRSALVDMWCNITLGLRPGLVIYTPYHSMHAYLRTYVRTYWPGCLPDFTVCQGAHLRHRHVPKLFTHSQYSQQHFWHNVAQFPYILKWVIHHHALVLLFSQHCHVRIRVRT